MCGECAKEKAELTGVGTLQLCDTKGCQKPAPWHPKITFRPHVESGYQDAKIPVVLGINACDEHRGGIGNHSVRDLLDHLKTRYDIDESRTVVEWVDDHDPDWQVLLRGRQSKQA
jgi:hypothetical protein